MEFIPSPGSHLAMRSDLSPMGRGRHCGYGASCFQKTRARRDRLGQHCCLNIHRASPPTNGNSRKAPRERNRMGKAALLGLQAHLVRQVDPCTTTYKGCENATGEASCKAGARHEGRGLNGVRYGGTWSFAGGARPRPRYPPLTSRSPTTSRPISAWSLVMRKWPTSVWPRSICSIRKTQTPACNWPPLSFAAAEVAAAAAPAVAAE